MKKSITGVGIPEPVPEWDKGDGPVVWKWALPAHSYFFGVIFVAVAVYGVYNLVKIWRKKLSQSRNYFISITGLICIFGITRAIGMLVDPYSTARPLHLAPASGLLLFSLGYPCLTSGFFLINWSLVEVTKLQLLPSAIHKRKVLALILTVHFVVVITFDSVFVFFPDTHVLLLICRSFFVVWGILLFGGFIVAAVRIQRQVKKTLKNLIQIEMAESSTENNNSSTENNATHIINNIGIPAGSNTNKLQQARTRKVMKIARRAAATGLLICCTQIYALWEFYVFYNDDIIPKAWPWWIYQTCFRSIELFMVSQMFLIVKPKK